MSSNYEVSMLNKMYAEAMQENVSLKEQLRNKEAKDNKFIISLCEQIWDILNGGTFYGEDFDKIETELKTRGINPDDIFSY